MELNRSHLKDAAENGLISEKQAEDLWKFLDAQVQDTPSFRTTHILYYLGGFIAIGAMSLFMTLGWETFGGWGLFFIALTYAGVGIWLTEYLLHRKRLPIPAGITATFVVALTPLAVYGLSHEYDIKWTLITIEFATITTGAVMLWRYRLPFLVMPIAFTLWYMSLDIAQLWSLRDLQEIVSLYFGMLMILLGLWVDIRTRHDKDYAFWLYLFGVVSFWCSLLMISSESGLDKFIFQCINLVMIAVGAILSRRVFAIFGGMGTAAYLGNLAYNVFEDSIIFPFTLTIIGLGVIYLGIIWQRNEELISRKLRGMLPRPMRELIERRH
jgi:hypothetical protein